MTTLTVGELVGYLDLDADPFRKNLDGAMRHAEAQGGRMKKVGTDLTTHLTLPLAAAGVASVKMSLDFEKSFSRMQGLAGVSADEVDGLKEAVMGLAGETGKAPQELAEALYFVRSAGLAGQDALDALEMSAKGAAAGLGDTVAVADAVTSAMNGYGSSVLSAAEATDVLVATAREGKVEASQLGPQMGRLIPIAAELGISFNDVGAAVAFLSRSNGDASLTATMLSGVMSKLLKPSQQGAEALDAVGLSAERVRGLLDENGLSGTMQILRQRLGDAGFNLLFDDVQALQGALQMTGGAAEDYIGVAERMGDVTGATDDAFAKWSETMGFKNQQAFADLQVAMIKLGDTLVPLVGKVAEFASVLLEWFSSLDDGSRTMIIALGGFVAALGPAIMIGTRLVTAVKAIGAAYQWAQVQAGLFAANGLGGLRTASNAAAGALGVATAAVILWNKTMGDAEQRGRSAAEGIKSQFDALDPASMSIEKLRTIIGALDGDISDMSDTLAGSNAPWDEDFRRELEASIDSGKAMRGEWGKLESAAVDLAKTMGISETAALRSILANEDLKASVDPVTGAFDDEAAATALATQELQGYADALSAMFDPLFAAQDAMLGLKEAQDKAATATREHGAKSTEAAEANRDLARAALENEQAMLRLEAAVESGDVKIDDAIATLNRWVDQGIITRAAADEQIWAFTVLADKANSVPDEVGIGVEADVSPAITALDRLIAKLGVVQGTFVANAGLGALYGVPGAPTQERDHGGPVLGPRGSPQMVLAHGGEIVLPTHRMGLGDALQHTLGIAPDSASPMGAGPSGKSTVIQGDLVVQTQDSPRRWFDEGLWRVAG